MLKLDTAEELEGTLNRYAREGWRCKFQYVVERWGGLTLLVVTLERKVTDAASRDDS